MNKFKGYMICTDCDGTLTNNAVQVSDENAEAIRYFQDEGGLFTLATGRTPEHINQFKDKFQINAPIVSLNGTAVYDVHENKLIHKATMKKSDCEELFDYINANWREVWEYWLSYTCFESAGYKPQEHPAGDKTLKEMFDKLPNEIYKILIMQPEEVTLQIQKDLKEKFGDRFHFDTSWANGLEIQDINSGKGLAVQYMKEHLYADIHTTVGIGDYENDISLLEYTDIGYAVGNALDSVKKAADKITVSNEESAIAAVVRDLEQSFKENRKKDET